MKKKLLIVGLVVISLLASFAISQTVTGQNWVGYVKVEVPPAGAMIMVGVNFDAVGVEGGGVPLNELINTNALIGSFLPTKADSVYLYDASKPGYNKFYYQDGTFKDAVTFTATNPVVFSGDAFWLQSSPTATESRDIYILGQVSLAGSEEKGIVEGYQLIANPYPSDLDLNGDMVDWSTVGATRSFIPTKADNVYIWNGSGYDKFYFGNDGSWKDAVTFQVATDAIIPVGAGAWYDAKGSFTNVFTRPFNID